MGDIHGGLKAFEELMTLSPIDIHKDKLVLIGDYVDGWSESAELIQCLIELKKTMGDRLVTILGNHDVWCYDYLHTGITPFNWTQQGGQATINSYIKTGYTLNQEHRDFFKDLVNFYIDEDNNIFIHGGWAYREDEFPVSALYKINEGTISKECQWDRSLLEGAKSGAKSQNPFKGTKMFNKVFIGHTATTSALPEKYGNLWNIDSGAGWFGKLTIMDVDTEEYWQSNFVKNYYPSEKKNKCL